MAGGTGSVWLPSFDNRQNQANSSVTRLLNENREGMGLEVFARGGNEMIIAARALKRKSYLDS